MTLTTELAIEAVEYERAPRHPGRTVNRRIVCADGFKVSVQASTRHYANDSSGEAPYWKPDPAPGQMPVVAYPFTTFEVGNPTSDPEPAEHWEPYDSGGVWAWVPPQLVAELLDTHGGAVGWETPAEETVARLDTYTQEQHRAGIEAARQRSEQNRNRRQMEARYRAHAASCPNETHGTDCL
jgi:hypothetical protein